MGVFGRFSAAPRRSQGGEVTGNDKHNDNNTTTTTTTTTSTTTTTTSTTTTTTTSNNNDNDDYLLLLLLIIILIIIIITGKGLRLSTSEAPANPAGGGSNCHPSILLASELVLLSAEPLALARTMQLCHLL